MRRHENRGRSDLRADPRALLGIVLALAAVLRLVGLPSFPEITADEGLWTNSTKNFVLFGDWFMDGRIHLLLSPVFHAVSAVVFTLSEPSIIEARRVSALAGVASVYLSYRLVLRLTGRLEHAIVAGVIFAANAWLALTARVAMIESLQLALALLGVTAIVHDGRRAFWLAGVALAASLLTKINGIFLLPVILGAYSWQDYRDRGTSAGAGARRTKRVLACIGVAVGIAAIAYAGFYLRYPGEFVRAFVYELDGVHFEGLSDPVARVGRFGLDPIVAARTVLELFREAPFLMVLAMIGCFVAIVERPPGSALFGWWLAIGAPYFLAQMYQPIRYLYLLAPAFVYFASVAVVEAGRRVEASAGPRWNVRGALPAIAAYLVFSVAYTGANALANQGEMLRTVTEWVEKNTSPDDRIMAAGYLCTDLPNRAYAHYHFARTPEQMMRAIERYDIRYVIVDDQEWRPRLVEALDARFRRVRSWRFGAVYEVGDGQEQRSTPAPRALTAPAARTGIRSRSRRRSASRTSASSTAATRRRAA